MTTMQCPADETLALFVSGSLDEAKRNDVLRHIESCGDCMAAVLSANAQLNEEAESASPASSNWRWWAGAVAAAVVIAVLATPLLRWRDPIGRLVALAPKGERTVEPRLSGGFAWAPYRGPVRSNDAMADAERLKLGGAAGDAIERAQRDASAEAQHSAGVALVLVDQPAEAIDRLKKAAEESPKDARAWNDLAAARYTAAVELQRPSLLPEALAAADAALRVDPRSAEALFNRALILEHLGLTGEARKAWLRYLDVDPGSQWATEARRRLGDLPASTRSSGFDRDRPLLENSAAADDRGRVRELVTRYPHQARTWGETEYLGQWGEAVGRDDAAATRWLTIARAIGGALQQSSGESLLHDAAASIDAASPAARGAIAQGHELYRKGRLERSREAFASAERDLRLAAARFDEGGSPMALVARFYAASARFAQNDVAGAELDLEHVLAEADARPRFVALRATIRWELARAQVMADEWTTELPILNEGAELYGRIGEHSEEAFLESMAAESLVVAGREDEAWSAQIRALHALSAEEDVDRLAGSVLSAMMAELRTGRREAALSFSAIAREIEGPAARRLLVIDTLNQKSLLETMTGWPADAQATAAEAERVAQGIPDAAARERALAEVGIVRGAALTDVDAVQANGALDRAIAFYRTHGFRTALPEPLLLRARCALRLRDAASARRDLDEGIAVVEQQRDAGTRRLPIASVLATERSLFLESIRLALDEHDPATAFAYAERARGGSVTAAETQRLLQNSDVAVMEIIAFPKELATIVVTSRSIAVGRSAAGEKQIETLARASSSADAMPALTALYDAIVRPVDGALAGSGRVIIVADPVLDGVPFAGLFDRVGRRHLIERSAVAMASSAASLLRDDRPRQASSLVAVSLPSGTGASTQSLPESEREVQDIAQLYPHTTSIAPTEATWAVFTKAAAGTTDVVHIAGHTARQEGAGDPALLFAAAAGNGTQRVSWKSVSAAPHIDADVVVLAACETLRRPASANTRALTLAEAFVAAGARDVAGTLVPIADRDAREMFRAFHQYLRSGDDAVDALRHVQLDFLRKDAVHAFPAWAGLAVLTTRIPLPQTGRSDHGAVHQNHVSGPLYDFPQYGTRRSDAGGSAERDVLVSGARHRTGHSYRFPALRPAAPLRVSVRSRC